MNLRYVDPGGDFENKRCHLSMPSESYLTNVSALHLANDVLSDLCDPGKVICITGICCSKACLSTLGSASREKNSGNAGSQNSKKIFLLMNQNRLEFGFSTEI